MIADKDDSNVDKHMPRLVNLNQDPLFSECVMYYLPEGRTTVGSSPEECDILISGLDIKRRHCVVYNKRGVIWVEPIEDAIVFVNGEIFLSREAQIEFKQQVKSNNMSLDQATLGVSNGSNGSGSIPRKSNDTLMNVLRYSFEDKNNPNQTNQTNGSLTSSSTSLTSVDDNIMTGRVLANGNRISFGRYHLFRYVHPSSTEIVSPSSKGK